MSEARQTLTRAASTIAEIAGYIHKFQANKTKVTNRELNHIVEQCQRASAQIGEAISQMPEEGNEPLNKVSKKPAQTQATPGERDLTEIITVLRANIDSPQVLLNPHTCFTKGQLTYIIEIIEQHQCTEDKQP